MKDSEQRALFLQFLSIELDMKCQTSAFEHWLRSPFEKKKPDCSIQASIVLVDVKNVQTYAVQPIQVWRTPGRRTPVQTRRSRRGPRAGVTLVEGTLQQVLRCVAPRARPSSITGTSPMARQDGCSARMFSVLPIFQCYRWLQ